MIEAERRGLILMVDHTFVYTPAVRCIRELIMRGDLGQIFYYDSTRINLGLFQRDANVMWDCRPRLVNLGLSIRGRTNCCDRYG